jgi:hypothetical protein
MENICPIELRPFGIPGAVPDIFPLPFVVPTITENLDDNACGELPVGKPMYSEPKRFRIRPRNVYMLFKVDHASSAINHGLKSVCNPELIGAIKKLSIGILISYGKI